jgi:hypothetical protein
MGRPAKTLEEKLVEVPCKVSLEVAELIAHIAVTTDRYRGQIARKLLYRGVAAYLRDGNLDEPNGAINQKPARDQSLPTESTFLPTDQTPKQYPTAPRIRNKAKGGKK